MEYEESKIEPTTGRAMLNKIGWQNGNRLSKNGAGTKTLVDFKFEVSNDYPTPLNSN